MNDSSKIGLDFIKAIFYDAILTTEKSLTHLANAMLPREIVDHGLARITTELRGIEPYLISNERCSDYESLSSYFYLEKSYKTYDDDLERRYSFFRQETLGKIFGEVERIIKHEELNKFRPEQAILVLLAYQTHQGCIDFFRSKVLAKWGSSKRLAYFAEIRKHLVGDIAVICEDSVGWQFINYSKWDPISRELDSVQMNYEAIATWLDHQVREYSPKLQLKNEKKQKQLLELLTSENISKKIPMRILDFERPLACSKIELNASDLTSLGVRVNYPELLVAIVARIKASDELQNSKGDVIRWLHHIGVREGFSTRTLKDRLNNQFFYATELKANELILSSILALRSI